MSNQKVTNGSKLVILLHKKWCNENILSTDNEKSAWKSDPVFMKHKLDNSRTEIKIVEVQKYRTAICTHSYSPSLNLVTYFIFMKI